MKNIYINRKNNIEFRQWTRKGFGLFSVLGKIVRISFLMVVYLLVAEPAEAQKEQSRTHSLKESDVSLEEIEVTGQRISTSLAQTARIVRVISSKEIAKSPYSTVTGFLDQELSLDIRQRGQEGAQSDISIQGSTYEQVLILINGVPLNNPQTGHFNGDIPVPMQAIQRIEIIRGGASRWLGPNAFAGAINIITKNNDSQNLNLDVSGGQQNYFGTEATKQFGKNSQQIISVSHIRTDGHMANTDLKSSRFYYQNNKELTKYSLWGQAGIGIKKFGAQAFYTPVYPDQYEEIEQGFVSMGWKTKGPISFKQDIYLRIHADEFHLFRGESPSWYPGPNQHFSRTVGMMNSIWWDNLLGRMTLGLDYKNEGVLSTVLGEALGEAVSLPFSRINYTNKAARQYLSFYGEQSIELEKFLIVGGLMGNIILDDSISLGFFPGVDIRYRLSSNSYLYFSANRSMRMPSFTELYYVSSTNQGNPNLLPEKSWSVQGGHQWSQSGIKLNTNVFAAYSKNLIDWSKSESTDKWVTRNINVLLRSGIEFEITYRPFSTLRWNNTIVRAGYSYIYLSQSSGDFDSRYVLDHLKHKWVVASDIPILSLLDFNIQMRFQDRAGWYTNWDESGEPYKQDYEPFLLTDIGLSLKLKQLKIYGQILNLMDVEYADIAYVNQPGRWIRIGVKLELFD